MWFERFQSRRVRHLIPVRVSVCADSILCRYEKFERVDMGDFNWLTPNFLAFASPQHQPVAVIPPTSPLYDALPRTVAEVQRAKDLPVPFRNVLTHFTTRSIGLVVRLNSELYSPSYFTALGVQHLDMIFDDGTCPPLVLVKKFIHIAHDMINNKRKGIAVHCKAGLGRTGCLIGAYLIYRHGFTANEIIAFMRFMRPGMVVGPQQHWLHLNQGTFREWWYEDSMKEKLAAMAPCTPTRSAHKQRLASNGQTFTPPNGSQKRAALGEIQSNEQHGAAGAGTGVQDENLPAPTPGQPRKTSKIYGSNVAGGGGGRYRNAENAQPAVKPEAELAAAMQRAAQAESESEEEFQLRMLARRTASRSPAARDKRRAVSCTTTTTTLTTTTAWNYPGGGGGGGAGGESDVENRAARPKTPGSTKSGSGSGNFSVGKVRTSPSRRSTEGKAGVRKTSGRVGSVGNASGAVKVKP